MRLEVRQHVDLLWGVYLVIPQTKYQPTRELLINPEFNNERDVVEYMTYIVGLYDKSKLELAEDRFLHDETVGNFEAIVQSNVAELIHCLDIHPDRDDYEGAVYTVNGLAHLISACAAASVGVEPGYYHRDALRKWGIAERRRR